MGKRRPHCLCKRPAAPATQHPCNSACEIMKSRWRGAISCCQVPTQARICCSTVVLNRNARRGQKHKAEGFPLGARGGGGGKKG